MLVLATVMGPGYSVLADDALQMHTWMTRLDTPLHVAALEGHTEEIEAAFQGHTEAVKALADELAVKALLDEL